MIRHCRSEGFTLIELMVAMAIALATLGTLLYLMAGVRAGYAQQDQLARLQENTRVALQLMTAELRMAGYAGCSALDGEGNRAFALVDHTLDAHGSAILTVRRAGAVPVGDADALIAAPIDAGDYPAGTRLPLELLSGLPDGWRTGRSMSLVLADCRHAAVVENVTVKRAGSNQAEVILGSSTRITAPFPAGTEVRALIETTWYIDNTAGDVRVNVVAPSLFRRIGDANAQNIVSGIEQLHVRFITDDATLSEPPSDLNRLRGIDIAVLARTVSNADPARSPTREYGDSDEGRRYQLFDSELTAGDGDLPALRGVRKVLTTRVMLRNSSG